MVMNKFFRAEELKPGIWQITNCFDSHAQMETFAYLIEGNKRAMLIDTMFGYGNLKTFCRELTDRPIFLVNTHYHGDHAGGNFDFDECYIHSDDIPYLRSLARAVQNPSAFRDARYAQMKHAALPENRDRILPTDFSMPHPMFIWPVYDGDLFDLGGKQIEIIHVGGHTPGEIVLLDRADRVCFTGDACNSNTLLNLDGSLSVEEYLAFLHHFKTFQSAFDVCLGGHESFDATIIDEGIELCERVLARTDDKEPSQGFGDRFCLHGANHHASGKGRADGKRFNIAYTEDNIYRREKAPRIL